MKTFEISIISTEPMVLLFSDEHCAIRIEDFDFSALDEQHSTIYSFNTVTLKQSRITNYQLKKKIKRTVGEFINSAILTLIKEHEANV